jgi:hypothetical protein
MFNNFREDFWLEFVVKEPIVERILDQKIILIKRKKIINNIAEKSV